MARGTSAKFEAGMLAAVEYAEERGSFHVRALLQRTTLDVLQQVMGFAGAGPEKMTW